MEHASTWLSRVKAVELSKGGVYPVIRGRVDHFCRICMFNAIMLIDEKRKFRRQGWRRVEWMEKDYKREACKLSGGLRPASCNRLERPERAQTFPNIRVTTTRKGGGGGGLVERAIFKFMAIRSDWKVQREPELCHSYRRGTWKKWRRRPERPPCILDTLKAEFKGIARPTIYFGFLSYTSVSQFPIKSWRRFPSRTYRSLNSSLGNFFRETDDGYTRV